MACWNNRGRGGKRPWGLKWRSSSWFVTLVVGLGVGVDLAVYSLPVTVIPYRLRSLGYDDVSSRTSYLLLSYSLGLVLSTLPIVILSEKFGGIRRVPLLFGLVFLAASQIMFMLAPNFAVMIVARFLQGVSGSMVWSLGLALLCDTVPEDRVGQQLGIAMTGVSIGFAAGPPIGGSLYQKLGFNAPFIFGVILTTIDFAGRLIVVERRDALKWGVDPWFIEEARAAETERGESESEDVGKLGNMEKRKDDAEESISSPPRGELPPPPSAAPAVPGLVPTQPASGSTPLTSWGVLLALSHSPRAIASFVNTLAYGIIFTVPEPTLTLRLNDVWGLGSLKVGLVYLASVVPTLFGGPLSGYLSDKYGAEYVAIASLMGSVPWWLVMIVRGKLALFITAFAVASFFFVGTVAPLTSELAATSRGIDGVGYAHVFGAWNLAFSVGSAIGPIIGGQIYDHVANGWVVLCVFQAALAFLGVVIAMFMSGETPVVVKMVSAWRGRKIREEQSAS